MALAVLAGTVFGVAGTGVGGLLGVAMGMPSPRALACLLNLTGGLMIALACFKMLPNAYALSAPMGLAGMLLGVAMTLSLDALLRRRMRALQPAGTEDGLVRAGLMVAAGSALHNLPEGLAVGSGCAQAPALGLALAAMILLHDVPEGMAAALPMRASGVGAARALAMTAASGVPAGVGAAAGWRWAACRRTCSRCAWAWRAARCCRSPRRSSSRARRRWSRSGARPCA